MKKNNFKIPYLLFLILFLGFSLRLYKLDFQSFWLDEYVDLATAQKAKSSLIDFHFLPPFYIILLEAWLKFFEPSETNVRLLGAIFGALSIPLFYLLGKECFNQKTALWASFFLSISALHIDYCQEAKYYSLMLMMVMLIHLEYLKILKYNRPRDLLLYGFYFLVGLYSYYLLFFLLIIQAVHLWLYQKTYKSIIPSLILAQIVILVLFSPYLFHIVENFFTMKGEFGWIKKPTFSSLVNTTTGLISGQVWYLNLLPFLNLKATIITHRIFLVLIGIFLWRLIKGVKPWPPFLSFVLIWAIVPTVVFYLFSILIVPIYHIRYVLFSVLGIYLLLAWIAATEKKAWLRFIFIGMFVILNISTLAYYYHHPVRPQFREAAEFVSQNCQKDEKIMVNGDGSEGELFQYYFAKSELRNIIEFDPRKKDLLLKESDWIVDSFGNIKNKDNISLVKKFFLVDIYHRRKQ